LLAALCLGPLFAYLPRFALAAVVIMAVAGLLDGRRLVALCRADKLDALAGLTTFTVTLLVGPERGILAGVAAAALCYLWRTWRMPRVEKAGGSSDEADTNEFVKTVLNDCKRLGKAKD
jgi:SulP family sulfate permease